MAQKRVKDLRPKHTGDAHSDALSGRIVGLPNPGLKSWAVLFRHFIASYPPGPAPQYSNTPSPRVAANRGQLVRPHALLRHPFKVGLAIEAALYRNFAGGGRTTTRTKVADRRALPQCDLEISIEPSEDRCLLFATERGPRTNADPSNYC
jgi:hypothetical protein